MKISKYKKRGKTFYCFSIYLGTDPLTGKVMRTNRRGFRTQREAIEAYLSAERDYGARKSEHKTFLSVYNEWLEVYKHTVRESSFVRTERIFKLHILPDIGGYKIKAFNLSAMQRQIEAWHKSDKDIRTLKIYVSKVFDYAIRLGIIDKNPCNLLYMPRETPRPKRTKKRKFWNAETLNSFLSHASRDMPPMWHAFFRLLAYTGMRKGEAMALEWGDVDFEKSRLHITKSVGVGILEKKKVYKPKTEKSTRTLDIDDETMKILEKWRKTQLQVGGRISKLLFTNSRGSYIVRSLPIKVLDSHCKRYGIEPITLHGFRHTHCSLLFASGASIKEVQERLGHSDVKTTMDIYAHVTETCKKAAINRFSAYLSNG